MTEGLPFRPLSPRPLLQNQFDQTSTITFNGLYSTTMRFTALLLLAVLAVSSAFVTAPTSRMMVRAGHAKYGAAVVWQAVVCFSRRLTPFCLLLFLFPTAAHHSDTTLAHVAGRDRSGNETRN